jgi:hypothetical protein
MIQQSTTLAIDNASTSTASVFVANNGELCGAALRVGLPMWGIFKR